MKNVIKILSYILLIVINIIFMLFIHSYELFILLVVLIILPIIFEISFVLFAKNIEFNIFFDKTNIAKGTKTNLNINIKSKTILSSLNFKLSIDNTFYKKYEQNMSFSIPALISKKIVLPIDIEKIGCYRASVDKIVVQDFFGILSKKIEINQNIVLYAMPKRIKNIKIKIGNTETDINWAIDNYKFSSGDIAGVRNYIFGDKLNTINWKSSARTDTILVKNYELNCSEEYMILFDFNINTIQSGFDYLYSVLLNIVENDKSCMVLWLNKGIEELNISFVKNKDELIDLIHQIFDSYPISQNGLTIASFRRQFGNSNAMYISDVEELI